MNKIVCIFLANLVYCNFWISYDIKSNYNITYNSGFLDNGEYNESAITIGYEKLFFNFLNIGGAVDVSPMKDDFSRDGVSFALLYSKLKIPYINLKSINILLGYNFPQYDIANCKYGSSYGLNIILNSNIGFNYIRNNLTYSDSNNGYKGNINRLSAYYIFH